MHAHVDTETETAKQMKRLLQQLVSARQMILQMHQIALQKDHDSDHTSDGLVGSLEEAAREHYAQMGGAVCSHMYERDAMNFDAFESLYRVCSISAKWPSLGVTHQLLFSLSLWHRWMTLLLRRCAGTELEVGMWIGLHIFAHMLT